MSGSLAQTLAELRPVLLDSRRLVRAVASGRQRGTDPDWRRVELRPVQLKTGLHLQVVRYDEHQAHTGNAPYGPAAEALVDEVLAMPFGNWHLDATDEVLQLRVTRKGRPQLHRGAVSAERADLAHDRAKSRLLDPADPFWQAVGLAGRDGRILPSRQHKYRQVEEFVRALATALDRTRLPADRPLRVTDLGCGNAYLTFAAYRYLTGLRGLDVELVGVDVKEQSRARNSRLAADLGWDGLRFVQGSIDSAPLTGADVVLALHACDTATDQALARAVDWSAELVLAAPCCHHDIQRQLRGSEPPAPYGAVVRHAILRERLADTLTDAFRAALLRTAGYRVEVVEFVPSQHTPRNTLLRAVRTGADPDPALAEEYRQLVAAWGVRPQLAELMERG